MSLKDRLKRQMMAARETSERFLADFKTPADWTRQIYPGANHALWFAGHMGTTDDFFISLISPERVSPQPGFNEKFALGSEPNPNPEENPPVEAVLAYMRERRTVLMDILINCQEADLSRPTHQGAPSFLPDVGSVFETAIWHEGLHSGQLSVVRRALGHPPLH